MNTDESVIEHTFDVVVNHEGQYSIWRSNENIPLGWVKAGKTGSKDECLAYIKAVWTDMRPLSLRRKMQERSS
jgi:MbtH protein